MGRSLFKTIADRLTALGRRSGRGNRAVAERKGNKKIPFEQILDSMYDAIIIGDAERQTLWVNRAFREEFGYQPEEVVGRMPRSFLRGAKTTQEDLTLIENASRDMKPVVFETVHYTKSGDLHFSEVKSHPIIDGRNRLIHFVNVIRDNSERLKLREEIEAAQEEAEIERERLNLVTQGSGAGYWDWDVATGEVHYSDRVPELLGLTRESFDNRIEAWQERVHPDDQPRLIANRRAHFHEGEAFDIQYRWRLADGSYRWFRARAEAFRDEHGRAYRVAGSITDIHELVVSKQEADRANRLKSEFLANVSHEIRTPMNGIMGMCQLMMRTQLTEEQEQFANIIHSSSKSLLTLINEILDLSKIEAGLLEVEVGPFNLENLLREVAETFLGIATEKGLDAQISVAPDVRGVYTGDEKRLRQVLVNLLGNAVKFTDKGAFGIDVKSEKGNQISVRIWDTGPGIGASDLDDIFSRFWQADGSSTRKHGGTGLGLAITKDLVELLGGTIRVESEVGKGSAFTLMLPLQRADQNKSGGTSHAAGSEAGDRPVRVLLAEDNEINQTLMLTILEAKQYKVDLARNGQEALDLLAENAYDLVLMDVQMPVMTGTEAIERVRESDAPYKDVPIIVLTANAMKGVESEYLGVGATLYVSKPIDFDDLDKKIKMALSGDYTQGADGQTLAV